MPFLAFIQMKKLLFTLLGAVIFTSCSGPAPSYDLKRVQASDLASPHIHNGAESVLYLADYSLDSTSEISFVPNGLAIVDDNKVVVLSGSPGSTLNYLSMRASTGQMDVPLFKGQRQSYIFRVSGFEGDDVKIKGVFNAWNTEATEINWNNGAWETTLVLAPGDYAYKLVVNGDETMDPSNPVSISNGFGQFNNVLSIPGGTDDGPKPLVFLGANDTLLTFSSVPENQEILVFFNDRVATTVRTNEGVFIPIPKDAADFERAWIRVYTARNGKLGGDWLIPMKFGRAVLHTAELDRRDWHTSIMYFAMVDRFFNGDATNDAPVPDSTIHPRANYQGGDIAGIHQKLNQGYFDSLGTNTVWISPITQNPENAWGLWNQGGPVSSFSGYHGYWPISNIKPDHRFASEQDVHAFLTDAHALNQNVLVDYVANHVHELHPVFKKHPNWATNKYTDDGRLNTQLWDEERLTTWFDTFMPTLELRNDTVADWMSDSALVWITEYDFDGFRHDATKHIPMNFTRLLTDKIRRVSKQHVYQIGETYGSDELIASYVGSGKVDGQFNFNLYDAAFEAFTQEGATFDRLAKALENSLKYYGHHHLMGNISGNQDKPRFASMASGHLSLSEDTKLAGWTREIPEPLERGYRKMGCLHAFNIAVPGIPILYYGDEIAMHGGNDPDNRKMMNFERSRRQQELFDWISTLNNGRQNIMALNYGSTTVEQLGPHILIIVRQYLNEEVRFFFNNSHEDRHLDDWNITVPADDHVVQSINCGAFFTHTDQ